MERVRCEELRTALSSHACCTEPSFLRACLRAKKWDVAKAALLAKEYAAFRQKVKWQDSAAGPSDSGGGGVTAAAVETELRSGFNILLPSTDVHGNVVLTQQMSKLSKDGGALERHQRAGYYLLHRALQRSCAQTRGIALVLDFRGFSLASLRKMGTADFRRGVAMLQDCFPARLSVIYILHQPRWIMVLLAVLRPLLRKQTLQQKFVMLGSDYSALHEHIPAASLPFQLDAEGRLAFEWDATVRMPCCGLALLRPGPAAERAVLRAVTALLAPLIARAHAQHVHLTSASSTRSSPPCLLSCCSPPECAGGQLARGGGWAAWLRCAGSDRHVSNRPHHHVHYRCCRQRWERQSIGRGKRHGSSGGRGSGGQSRSKRRCCDERCGQLVWRRRRGGGGGG